MSNNLGRGRGRFEKGHFCAADGYGYANAEGSNKKWTSWLVPLFVVANVAVFVFVMYVNDCPKKNTGAYGYCVVRFFGRLSFQPLRENPLFGPSSST